MTRAAKRTMLLSVRAKRLNGTFVQWRDIADAQPGSPLHNQMVTWIERVRAVGEPVWFTFNHEPEIVENQANGVDVDYIAAWQKVISEFRNRGVTNANGPVVSTGGHAGRTLLSHGGRNLPLKAPHFIADFRTEIERASNHQ